MANHKLLVPKIKKWEGGWADDPRDAGGATMSGVTIGAYRTYRRAKGLPAPTKDDLRNITPQEWAEIFKTMYWDRWHADRIDNQSIAEILVDWLWASGSHGIRIPQRLLGVSPDGAVGPVTLAVLNSASQAALFARIKQARVDFVEGIIVRNPSQACFRRGWMNRIDDFDFVA